MVMRVRKDGVIYNSVYAPAREEDGRKKPRERLRDMDGKFVSDGKFKKVAQDIIIKARTPHTCNFCGAHIEAGSTYRRETWQTGNGRVTRPMCLKCMNED